ncbi:hypothetical protein AVEN_104517-1 [Araneus ventricosus]|uniref:Uncharacterized protein n=1 Tax=Araneus ventricosus TaxID=182803 RepID=A0A4Y2MAS4_ARAVE|nr:hypothetical protein AVEN_104517-1 [Araneus ventricosus]
MDNQFEKLFAMMAEMKAGQEEMRVAQAGWEQKMEVGQEELRVAQAGLEQKMEPGQEDMRSGQERLEQELRSGEERLDKVVLRIGQKENYNISKIRMCYPGSSRSS